MQKGLIPGKRHGTKLNQIDIQYSEGEFAARMRAELFAFTGAVNARCHYRLLRPPADRHALPPAMLLLSNRGAAHKHARKPTSGSPE